MIGADNLPLLEHGPRPDVMVNDDTALTEPNDTASVNAAVHLISFSADGHRSAYNDVLAHLLRRQNVDLSAHHERSRVAFYPMLDDNIPVFLRSCLQNALSGRRTVGLFFRPGECFRRDRVKYRLKNLLFRVLKRMPTIRILTIMPFHVDPRFALVANDWIHDPQLWDMDLLPAAETQDALSATVRAAANGRQVVVALGGQNRLKGFDRLATLWQSDLRLRQRYLFVAAGKVAAECAGDAQAFVDAGGLLLDRFISDEELLALYTASDVVWSCYAPHYNQASGIFGRAFQMGKPAIVREGSYIAAMAKHLDHPVIAIAQDNATAANELLSWPTDPTPAKASTVMITAMRQRDTRVLLSAFGIDASGLKSAGTEPLPR